MLEEQRREFEKARAEELKKLQEEARPVEPDVMRINFNSLVMEGRPWTSGSFKTVYKALWTKPGTEEAQRVAVLVIRGGTSAVSEVSIFQQLGRHPHLTKLLATSSSPGGDYCMVMEFAERGSLDHVLHEIEDGGAGSASHSVLLTAASQVSILVSVILTFFT